MHRLRAGTGGPRVVMDAAGFKQIAHRSLARHPFHPAWWLPNGHAQTFWTAFPNGSRHIHLNREDVPLPDGDSVFLHSMEPNDEQKPVVLLLHGLEGSAQSSHVRRLLPLLHRKGWGACIMEYRGCGGSMNRLARYYHSGDTDDLEALMCLLRRRHGTRPLFAVGFSLGANVLARWMVEKDDQTGLCAAALAGVPYDLAAAERRIDESLGGFYARRFLASLLQKARAKARQFPGCINLDRLRQCRSVYEYDDIVTAPLHGFADADEYYRQSSCGPVLPGVHVPTLVISAEDDPIVPSGSIPRRTLEVSPWIVPLICRRGGHLGFFDRAGRPWAEHQMLRFFELALRYTSRSQ